jgi:site-specific recombinase XerD
MLPVKLIKPFILGHAHSKTTEIYTDVSTKSIGEMKSPLDTLNLKRKG